MTQRYASEKNMNMKRKKKKATELWCFVPVASGFRKKKDIISTHKQVGSKNLIQYANTIPGDSSSFTRFNAGPLSSSDDEQGTHAIESAEDADAIVIRGVADVAAAAIAMSPLDDIEIDGRFFRSIEDVSPAAAVAATIGASSSCGRSRLKTPPIGVGSGGVDVLGTAKPLPLPLW